MKKKKILIPILLTIIIGLISLIYIAPKKEKAPELKPIILEQPIEKEKNGINIEKLQTDYHNENIIGYIIIPNVVNYPILQTDNNEYYLNHDIEKNQNIKGSIFMDYRVTYNDNKILIYGHSGKEQDLPFLQLNNYDDESFFKDNSTIYLYSKDKVYTYEIFSSYVETKDLDYVNIKSFNGLTWLEHLEKLKDKSNFKKDITLTNDTKILILQTCSMNQSIYSEGGKYKLIIAKLIKTEDNLYE